MQNDNIPHQPAAEHTGLQNPHPRKPQKEGWRSIATTVLILLAAPLVAIMLTALVFQSYEVEGQSMETTLQDNDRLIVWKLGKTWSNMTNQTYVPKRNDIVIFHRPADSGATAEGDKQLIKRVVALPGERVVISGGIVTVYNQESPDGFQPDKIGGYKLAEPFTSGNVDVTLGEGEVFVCGDNRSNSMDSRNFGPISTDEIVGNLVARLYPFNKFDTY